MTASKMIGVLFVVFGVVIGANGIKTVDSTTTTVPPPVVVYDDSLERITMEAVNFAVQSLDFVLVGEEDYPPIEEDVTFWCTKPNSSVFTQVLLNDPNFADNFDLTKPLAFVVHGWASTFRGGFLNNFTETNGWMELLANDFGEFTETNVCCLDWSRLALYEYTLAVNVNLPLVVSYFTEFVTQLLQLEITAVNNLTIIGHSLGAHIAGRVGANLNGTIKTIYGLDPAGPLFTLPLLTPTSFRLDPTDAQYVQALHTDALGLGSGVNLGHTDIYANGGTLQPGCLLPLLDMESPFAPIPVICDHYASVAFFTTASNPIYEFITTEELLLSTVHDLLGPFGLGIHGQFVLTTQESFPYGTTVSS